MILALAIILTIILLAVCYFDFTRFIIPNELNLGLVLLYPAFLVLTPAHIEWWWSLVVMLCVFGFGFLIYLGKIMGGGDIKLLVALSLWIGWQPQGLMLFLFGTAISGGVLTIALIIIRLVARKLGKEEKMPKVFQTKSPVPYGLAIAYSFGFMLWTGKIVGF